MSGVILAALPGPLAAGLIAAVGFWLKEVWSQRDQAQRHSRVMRQANDEITFIEAWDRVYSLLAEPESRDQARFRLLQDLDRTYTHLAEAQYISTGEGGTEEEEKNLRPIISAVLLRNISTRPGKGARVLYYLSLLWTIITTAVGSTLLIHGEIGAGIVSFLLFGVIPAWLIRSGVLWLNGWSIRKNKPSASPAS